MSATSKTKELASFEQTHGLKMLLFVDADNHVAKACYMLIEASTPEELEKVHYKQTNGLNGNVMYYNLNGTMSNGIAYLAGRPRHKLTQLPESEVMALKNGDGSRTVQGCTIHYIETGYTGCVYDYCHWYSTGYVGFPVCENSGSHVENDVEDDFEGGTLPSSVATPREIRDSVQNPCIKAQLNLALTAKTTILNMLNNTFSGTVPFEDLSLTFKDITTLPNNIDGTMQRLSGIEYEIRLNQNKLPNASKEYILATIYHEILHAFLESKLIKGNDGKYIITDQHQQMATNYITLMTGALQVAFPSLSNNEAWALSWGGLEKTPFYTTKLTDAQRTQINDLNNKHKDKLAIDKLGTYCN